MLSFYSFFHSLFYHHYYYQTSVYVFGRRSLFQIYSKLETQQYKFERKQQKQMMNKLNQASNVLYISNFPKRTTKQDLEKLLEPCGELLSVNIIQKPQYAFAFVQFDDIRDAAYAIKELDQKLYNGMNLKIQFKNRKNKENQQNFQKNPNKLEKNDNISSPIQTNSSLPLQKLNLINLDIKGSQSDRYRRDKEQISKIKNNKYAVPSEYSKSRSRSRSRSKGNKKGYSNNCEQKYRNSSYKQREKCRSQSMQKYRSHNQHLKYATQQDVSKMFDIIKNLQRNLRRMQEKFSDFLYDYKHSSNFSPSRRR